MALTNSGQISMGDTAGTNRRIFQEKTGLTQSTVQAQNISLRGFSVDGIADYQDEDGDDVDVIGTPNNAAPYAMSEFYGYSQFAWGTPGSITTNTSFPFNGYQEDRDGDDTDYASACNMVLNTSTKIISFTFTNTDEPFGGYNVNIGSTNTATISYSGTLSTLEARFVHSGQAITSTSSGGDLAGKVFEVFSNTSHLSSTNISNNNTTGSAVTNSNNITAGPSGTYRSLRTTTGNMSAMLAVCTDNTSSNGHSRAKIAYSGSDSLKIQLRANGSTVVDLYTRTGSFYMEAQSFDQNS